VGKKLIINADDFGLYDGINRGIMTCYEKGIVNRISLVACGEAYQDAVHLAHKRGKFRIGVHLTVTGPFCPVTRSRDVRSLLADGRRFHRNYANFLLNYFSGGINLHDLYVEFTNQIARIRGDGFEITHLDSHHHVHMVPGVLRLLVKIAVCEGIKYVRLPLERKLIKDSGLEIRNRARRAFLLLMCDLSKSILIESGLRYNDNFFGHFYSGALKRKILLRIISGIDEGLTEINCHPGYLTHEIRKTHSWYQHCETELRVLCDSALMDEIRRNEIELVRAVK